LTVGKLAIARISPVRGSITITDPPAARFSATPFSSSRSAMCCRYASMVSSIVSPCTGGFSTRLKARPRRSISTRIFPGCPLILELYDCSIPASPLL
jgi:hypothetical protein